MKLAAALTVLSFGIVMGSGPVAVAASTSESVEQRCSLGDAQALFQTLEVPYQRMLVRGHDHPGLLDAFGACQYRVWFDGDEFTFCEDDWILGGIVWFWDYKAAGIPRREAVADIELNVDRVWIDGVEQTLEKTSYKNIQTDEFGPIVYQQRGFITKLPPGDHLSYWLSTYPGLPDLTATVILHILPRQTCS